jgi:ribose/xylose/arabinose/galactoside ABC-type transport system permease subunit
VVALSSVVSAKLLTAWLHVGTSAASPPATPLIALAIGLCLLMGLAIGLLHALMINQFRLPPFIATLATMAGLRSVAALLSGNRTINVPFAWYRVLGSEPWWTLSIFALVATTASIMMGATVLGRHLFALGGNEMAARLSGLPTQRLKAVAYGLSGMLAALGGILFAGRTGQADPRLGVTYELYAITAAVVGGCSLSGGVGSVRGTVLGLFLIQIVIKGTAIIVRGIDSSQIEGLVLGTVVVLAVAFNQRFRGRAA